MRVLRRTINLPLHTGKCPTWLYKKMEKLAKIIIRYIFEEYGEKEVIRRASNPFWFQAFSNVLGFDWHSSGSTTTAGSALKKAINELEGIRAAGGKGREALKTPEEIKAHSNELDVDEEKLVEASKIIAKTDNSLVQDGYKLYHHLFLFTKKEIAVIQQGMNTNNGRARRYHWLSPKNFFDGSQEIVGELEEKALVLVGNEKEKIELRKAMLELSKEVVLPSRHKIKGVDLSKNDLMFFKKVKEINPLSFKELLIINGMGEKRIRSLALIASLLYGKELDWKDHVKYVED